MFVIVQHLKEKWKVSFVVYSAKSFNDSALALIRFI